MDSMLASKVELRPTGQVAIGTTASQPGFEFVYRAGRDVEWNSAEGCFLTPHSGAVGGSSLSERISRIAEVLATELGTRLVITQDTEWVGVPDDIRAPIQARYKP